MHCIWATRVYTSDPILPAFSSSLAAALSLMCSHACLLHYSNADALTQVASYPIVKGARLYARLSTCIGRVSGSQAYETTECHSRVLQVGEGQRRWTTRNFKLSQPRQLAKA